MSRPSLLPPGPELAEHAARSLYGIAGTASPLPGEFDANFLIRCPDGTGRVLKIHSPVWRDEDLDLQNRALIHLEETACDLPLPRLLIAGSGERMPQLQIEPGEVRRVRLLTWLEGEPMAATRPHPGGMLAGLGRFLGRLDAALASFDHPAAHRALLWDLQVADSVIGDHIRAIRDPARRGMIAGLVEDALERLEPQRGALRRSVVHNDANDHNVLVAPDGSITGLIDFGDMIRTWTVSEPAIGATYAMLGAQDPVAAAAAVVAGYHAVHPLKPAEQEVVSALILLRLATSVSLSAHRSRTEPENTYLAVSEAEAWQVLEGLARLGTITLQRRLVDTCRDQEHA